MKNPSKNTKDKASIENTDSKRTSRKNTKKSVDSKQKDASHISSDSHSNTTSAHNIKDYEVIEEVSTSQSITSNIAARFSADKSRFITAIVLIAALTIVLSINSPLLICVVLCAFCLVGIQESLKLYGLQSALHYYIATTLAWVCAYFNDRVIESALFILVAYASYLAYSKKISPKTLLPFLYPLLPFLSIYALYKDAGGAGIWVLIWLIVIVAFTDTGAYFGGKAFGKTPFCPTSPKKTIEGVICGVACGVIVGSLVGIGPCGGFFYSLIITIVVAISSVFGDLFESYLKREADVKDSGTLLPGHGGVLDRFDAILFGAVVMHFLLFFLPGYNNLDIML
ncbi:phosphatidate cytidylyltransferase [Helicobacter typhlonius]|uniref:Phosphatidate cytidylyltransferase n=1 Tax=Helicobacter typhlonius TaxID=76936 RepID=A0A099UDU1_9HELI|nr:phosphatidate cytidylyltransferase [Helicobacter typhlonius]TLD79434.1 phosphatidate cytidylyltransferase [Helicobacter typhlonius]CUU39467.1 Phosphatidate cytidylyltransferase [Helicobacter typhlonius]HCD73567.1 phosphatidate cytidylyltransferase [Helicobacter sp.]